MKKKIVWLCDIQKRNISTVEYSSAIIWWYGILEKFGYDVVYEEYAHYEPDEFYGMIKQHNPDFVFHPTYTNIHTELTRIREFTKLYIVQSDDRWRYDNYSKYWIPWIDGVITFEGDSNKYVSDGLNPNKFCKMNWSFNPNTMCLNEVLEKNKIISHVGSLSTYRQEMINKFNNQGCDIKPLHGIGYETVKNEWARSKYSLNFTMNSTNQIREPKGRIVEVPNYCVLVSEPFDTINEYLKDDEYIQFTSISEAIEKINYYNDNPNEYIKLFNRGRFGLWTRNTAYHEWNKILPLIDPDYVAIDPIAIIKEYHLDQYLKISNLNT